MIVKLHITLDGKAEEALNFYAYIFNGKADNVLRYGEVKGNPLANEQTKGWLMNSRLTFGSNVINLCDRPQSEKGVEGNLVALDLMLSSEDETKRVFNALAEDGTVDEPLTAEFWSPCVGAVTDRFGIHWNVMLLTA